MTNCSTVFPSGAATAMSATSPGCLRCEQQFSSNSRASERLLPRSTHFLAARARKAFGQLPYLWRGLGLLAWGIVVIGGIDSLLRPLLSKGRMELPNLLVFLTLFGGITIFGVKGLLLGPLFGSLAVTGLLLIARERSARRELPPPSLPEGSSP